MNKVELMEKDLKQKKDFSELRSEMEHLIARVETQIQQKIAKTNQLDLVIVMECTGSMKPWIGKAKAAIASTIDNVKRDHPRANVRVGFVAYRDFSDGEKRLQIQTLLTTDVQVVRGFIGSLSAFGGGDGPEDIPGGLEAAMKMPFEAEAKRIVLVTDSPCHGSKFHDLSDHMTYQKQIEQSPDICAQMRELAKRGIDFTFIEVNPPRTFKMIQILRNEFNGEESFDGFGREFQQVSLSSAQDAIRFASTIQSSASSSLKASKERSSKLAFGAPNFFKNCGIRRHLTFVAEGDEEEDKSLEKMVLTPPPSMKTLDWNEVFVSADITAVRQSLHFRTDEAIDWKHLNLKHAQQETTIRLTKTCFAKGVMRSAHAMYDCKMEKYLVAKFYFGRAARAASASKDALVNDVKMQVVAKRLATEFSLLEEVENGVDFIFTCWYEIKDPSKAGLNASMSVFTAEPYIRGEYKKYNNNNGWTSDEGLNLSDTAQAFSHFTWQKTFGELMVVDLQGVGCIFTDPQIHSKQRDKFGCGNLSDIGIIAFFATHDCNSVCRAVGLEPVKSGVLARNSKAAKSSKDVAKWKSMTCSCPLCGSITVVLRSAFIQAYREGQEVYCEPCTTKAKRELRHKCCVCTKKFKFSPYWHAMKGIAPPTSCKQCAVDISEDKN